MDMSNKKKVKIDDEEPVKDGSTTGALVSVYELPGRVATREAAAAVDAHLPLETLLNAMKETRDVETGECVAYWMRMEDMRGEFLGLHLASMTTKYQHEVEDNRALTLASQFAQKHAIPLVVLFVISPGDYGSHDRSPRRIDFMLRNLKILKVMSFVRRADAASESNPIQSDFQEMNIPLYVTSHRPRKEIPNRVISILQEWKATRVFANMEYEVDELRRDISVTALGRKNDTGIEAKFVSDKLIVEPLSLATNSGTQYAVSRLVSIFPRSS